VLPKSRPGVDSEEYFGDAIKVWRRQAQNTVMFQNSVSFAQKRHDLFSRYVLDYF
jgi:hypothetical protein